MISRRQRAGNRPYSLIYSDSYTNGTTGTYGYVTSQTNPKSQMQTWEYDFNTGQVTSAVDINGVSSAYAYGDPLDRVTTIVKAQGKSAESHVNVSYNVGTTLVDVYSDQVAAKDEALHTQTLYDGFGRESTDYTFESGGTTIATTKTYDALGRAYKTTNPSRGSDGLGYATTILYDALGRPLSVATADGAVASTAYVGNQTTVTDQAAKQRVYMTDGLGRLTKVTEDPSNSNYVTSYTYDALDDLIGVSQTGLVRSFAYDGLKRLLAASHPENASSAVPGRLSCAGATGSKWTSCYAYDGVGNLLSKTDNRNTTTSYSYDSLNRVTGKSYVLGTGVAATASVTYCYDAVYNNGCQAGVTGFKGHLTGVVSSNSSTFYNSFDALGRVLSQSQVTAGNTYGFNYTYNLAGTMTSEQYPSGRLVNTCYDGTNRVVQVGLSACGSATPTATVYAGSVTYAPHGAPWVYVMGNGVDHSPNYNSRLQVCGIQDVLSGGSFSPQPCGTAAVTGGTPLLNVSLNWGTTNNNGDLLGSTFTHGGPGFASPLAFTQSYTYDGVNRLASVTETGYTRGFGYDPFGNMYVSGATVISPAGNTPQAAGLFAGNQLKAGSYDAAGNQLVVNGNNVTYDAEGRQTGVSGLTVNETYVYDGDGRRVGKVSNNSGTPTTVFVYDAMGRMAAEYSSVVDTPSCVTCYMSGDQLGTARLITDQSGNVVSRHDYLPFGEEIGGNGQYAGRTSVWGPLADSISQKFTGKERDSESGLDYFGARYYGSALGRWTSPDEVFADQHPTDPQSWNLYGYVRNNPLASIDDNGRTTLAISMGGQQYINVKQQMQAAATGARNAVVGALKNAANNIISIGNAGSSLIKAVSGGTVDLGQAAPVATSTAESQAADAAVTLVGLGMGVQGGTESGGGLPDDAFVVRGGLNTPENFANGSGVSIDANGNLQGVSVNSAAGKSVAELSQGIPNNKVGVTTVGSVRDAGGNVTASPTAGNPNHCTMCGVSPEAASKSMRVIPNPAKQPGQQQ